MLRVSQIFMINRHLKIQIHYIIIINVVFNNNC